MKRDVELAKKLLESKGYKVSKKMNEAFVDGVGYVDPITARRWAAEHQKYVEEHPEEFEGNTMTPEELKAQGAVQASEVKVGDTIQADFDASEIDLGEFYTVKEILDDGEGMGDLTFICDDGMKLHFDRDDFVGFKVDPKDIPAMRKSRAKYDLKSYESKKMNEAYADNGFLIRYTYPGDSRSEYEASIIVTAGIPDEALDIAKDYVEKDEPEAYNFRVEREINISDYKKEYSKSNIPIIEESKKLKETKYIAGYHKNPRGYGTARVDLKSFDTEEEVERYCRMMNYDTGYTDEYGIKRYIDYVVESEEEVLKPQYESEDLKYVSNVNGYSTYRKIENGKGVWFAKRQDDPDDKMFPISYEQARGFKEMPDETEIERLQREMGKLLLPKNEGLFKKKSKAGDQMRDLAKSAQGDVDDIKAQMEKLKSLKKTNESEDSNSDWVDITDIIGIKQPPLKKGDRFAKGPVNDLPYVVQKVDGPYVYYTADFEESQELHKMHASNVAIVWRPSEHRYIYAQGRFRDNAGRVDFPIPKEVQDGVSESKKMRESTDDRQQRRIVKNIANEVIRAKGENNSVGTYDEFIRKMVRNWATSGQDRDFIKSAIEKSFDKEFNIGESKLSDMDIDRNPGESEQGRYARPRRGRKPNGDEKDDKVFTPGSEDERDHKTNESKSPLQEALIKSLKKLHESESLDYEDMKYWNPTAIGSEVADYLGTDATQEEIESEIANILDRDDPKFQRAVDKALKEIEWDKESMSQDPMNGNHYKIGGSTPNVTEYGTDYDVHDGGYADDPEIAIIKWLRLSKNSPTMISIDTNKNAYAQELLQWVLDNEEKFRKLCQKYNCPYKVDYMIDGCRQKLQRPSNFETKYNYPDQIYPFALG